MKDVGSPAYVVEKTDDKSAYRLHVVCMNCLIPVLTNVDVWNKQDGFLRNLDNPFGNTFLTLPCQCLASRSSLSYAQLPVALDAPSSLARPYPCRPSERRRSLYRALIRVSVGVTQFRIALSAASIRSFCSRSMQ